MKSLLLSLLSVAALASGLSAQKLSVEFTAPLLGVGNLTLKIHDASGNGYNMSSPCGDIAIFVGSKTGPQVPNSPTCGPGFTPISAYGTFTYVWPVVDPAGNPWPESDYWFRIRVQNPLTGGQIEEWFCHRWLNSGAWLGVGSQVNVGQSTSMSLGNGPANGFFWIVAARSQTNPFTLFGQDFCLTPDAVFFSTINNPTGLMTGSFGGLDPMGGTSATLNVPNLVALQYQNVALQALTIDIAGTGAYGTTNPATLRILP